jgi:hypothetical protein
MDLYRKLSGVKTRKIGTVTIFRRKGTLACERIAGYEWRTLTSDPEAAARCSASSKPSWDAARAPAAVADTPTRRPPTGINSNRPAF